MLPTEKKEPTHSYKNLKTKREFLFYFEKSPHPFIWYLITTDGQNIGEWNKKTRMFYMAHGLSNYVISKLNVAEKVSTPADRDRRWLERK